MATQRRHFYQGITGTLVALLITTLLPIVLLEGYRGAQDVQRRRNAISERVQSQAKSETGTIDDFIEFTDRFLGTLARIPAVQAMNGPDAEALLQAARGQNPNYEDIFLVDTAGRQIASTVPSISDPDVVGRPYFQEALASGRLALSDVLLLPDTDRAVVVLAYPVTTAGEQRGVLALVLNIGRLSTVIGYTGLPAGSVVLLVQGDGAIIAADEPDRWVGQTLAGSSLLHDIRHDVSGTARGKMPDGVTRVTGFEPLARAPWTVVAAIPRAELDAAMRRSLIRITQQSVLVAAVTLVVAWAVVRRVAAPVRVLAEGARAFAAGDLDRRIPLQRHDELGDLADAFNGMAAALDQRLRDEAAHAEALRDLNRRQTEFVAVASHELRSPVAAIRSYTEALLRPDITDDETRRECLDGLDRSSARLAALARTLLNVSRIDAGELALTVHPTAVAAVARRAIDHVADEGRIRLETGNRASLVTALADPERLEDIIANLLDNALKFSPPDQFVTVQVESDSARVQVYIDDRGPGVANAVKERIFDRFYQVDAGPTRAAGGAGLGLYIARAYAVAMGGTLSVTDRPGGGSRFVLTLPASTWTNTDGRATDGATAARGSGRG